MLWRIMLKEWSASVVWVIIWLSMFHHQTRQALDHYKADKN